MRNILRLFPYSFFDRRLVQPEALARRDAAGKTYRREARVLPSAFPAALIDGRAKALD